MLCVVINMKNKEKRFTKIYFAFSVLLLTSVCVVVYTSVRNGNHGQNPFPESIVEQNTQKIVNESETVLEAGRIQHSPWTEAGLPEAHPSVQEQDPSQEPPVIYYVKETDGCLNVYESITDKLFMETDILYELLPSRVQSQIKNGKYFTSEEALLEFLENYSS